MFLLDYPEPLNLLSSIAFPSFPLVSSTSTLLNGWQGGIARSPPIQNPFGVCPGTLEQEGIRLAAPGGLLQAQPPCFLLPAFDSSICFVFWFSERQAGEVDFGVKLLSGCVRCVGQRQLSMEGPRSKQEWAGDLEDIVASEAAGEALHIEAASQPAVCIHRPRAEPAGAWRGQMEELRTSQLGSRTKGCFVGELAPVPEPLWRPRL